MAEQFELAFRQVPKYTGRTDGGYVKRFELPPEFRLPRVT